MNAYRGAQRDLRAWARWLDANRALAADLDLARVNPRLGARLADVHPPEDVERAGGSGPPPAPAIQIIPSALRQRGNHHAQVLRSLPGGQEPTVHSGPANPRITPGLQRPIPSSDDAAMTTAPTSVSLPLAPGRWEVDPNHSSIGFTIRHLGVSKVRGRFARFDAEVVIGETLDTTTVRATVDVASIDTANADRDAHVLSADIIDVAKRPTMVFRSTRIVGAGIEYQIDGELTIGDITRPIVLAVELGGIESFPGGPSPCRLRGHDGNPP